MNDRIKLYAFADEAGASVEAQIAAMRRNDLQGIEIRNVDGETLYKLPEARVREIKKQLDDAGLITWSIGSPIGKIDIAQGDHAEHMVNFKRLLDYAHIMNAKNLRMFSYYIPKGDAPEKWRDEVFVRLERLIEAAEGSGVTLCHENEKGIYGDTFERCAEILSAFPKLKGIYDAANYIQCGCDALEAWNAVKPYVRYMHVKDALQDGSVVPAGCGIGHLDAIIPEYIAQGGCAFTLEPHLTVFEGLKNLEQDGARSAVKQYTYPDADAAFNAACDALKTLLGGE